MIVPFSDLTGKSHDEIVQGYLDQGFDKATAEAYTAVLLGEGGSSTQVSKAVDKYDAKQRRSMAETGAAMPDGSYPVADAEDLSNAVSAVGRSGDSHNMVRKHIIGRAKALGLTSKIPAGWQPDGAVQKAFVVDIAKAQALAEQVGHDEFKAEVDRAFEAGVDLLELNTNLDGDIIVKQPDLVAVSVETTEGELQPLIMVGDSDDMTLAQKRSLLTIATEVAEGSRPLAGRVEDGKLFVPGLGDLRDSLFTAAGEAALAPRMDEEPFDVFSTAPAVMDTGSIDGDVVVKSFHVQIGGYVTEIPFPHEQVPSDIRKSFDEEKHYALMPVYMPDQVDAHGDWTQPDDIQKAIWDFNSGDRMIALQHRPDLGRVGEVKELMTIPWDHDVVMHKADGSAENVHFPAGTAWAGIQYPRDDVWSLVKSGKVSGLSIGGTANMIELPLDEAVAKEL